MPVGQESPEPADEDSRPKDAPEQRSPGTPAPEESPEPADEDSRPKDAPEQRSPGTPAAEESPEPADEESRPKDAPQQPSPGTPAAQPPPEPSREVLRPKNLPERPHAATSDSQTVEGVVLDQRDQKLAYTIEQRILQVIRRETRDPYGGLPADDVLANLEERFPDANIAERMMARLESEQTHRQSREVARDEVAMFEAVTRRMEITEDVKLQSKVSARAERVVVFLVVAGLILVFGGHERVGGLLLGATLVGVVSAIVTQRVRMGRS